MVDHRRGVDSVLGLEEEEGSLTEAPLEEEEQAQLAHPPFDEQAILMDRVFQV